MPRNDFIPLLLRPCHSRPQPIDLMRHAGPGTVGCIDEGRIQFADRFAKRRHRLFNTRIGLRETGLQVRRQRTSSNHFANFVRALEHFGQTQLVARQNALVLGFQQRRREARQNRRHSSQQFLVNDAGLREVRDFSRSAGVDKRRQQIVLDDGTKKRVGTESLRSFFDSFDQFFRRAPLFTHCKLTAVGVITPAPYYCASAILHFKKQRGRGSHFHLLVISRRLERLAPRQQRLIEFGSPFNRRPEQRFCEIVEIFVRWIEQDDAPIRKQPRKQQAKRAAQTLSRTIRLTQPRRDLGISQKSGGMLDHGLNLPPELDSPHGRVFHRITIKRRTLNYEAFRQPLLGKERNMVDLGQIVILGRQPEHRDAVHSGRRRLFRQLDRGQRFEDRKERPAEETDLLPRNRRERSSLKPLNIGQSLGGGAPRAILPLENVANLAAARSIVGDALGFVLYPLGKNR